MKFQTSAEVALHAHPALIRCRRPIDFFLNAAFALSGLAALDCTLRYVPIIMPEDMKANYPERSKLHSKERAYDCAPVLDYEVFIDGSLEDQSREYLRGLAIAAPHLADLGASSEQIKEFHDILAEAAEQVLAIKH